MLKILTLFVSSLSLLSASAGAADFAATRIECNGKTNDARAIHVFTEITRDAESSATALITITLAGETSPEILHTKLVTSSEHDAQERIVTVFRSRISPDRVFAARTTDLKSGVGTIQINAMVRAPLMTCTFN